MAMSRIRIPEPMQHTLLPLPLLLLVLIVGKAAAGSLVSPNNRQPSQRFFYAAATSSSSTQTKVRLLRQADDPGAAPGALGGQLLPRSSRGSREHH
ncbi:GM22920 [Drosophila sechellia]|uniref:GM22920 n=1 Tax=Drosophila sechellia TaxID=7238 RepID=B4I6X6_DROSE|nr:GM22920 [Drosophila sechellia]